MPMGVPVGRQWVFIQNNGEVVIDWGDNLFQDVYTGEFFSSKGKEFSRHLIQDNLLDYLKRTGLITGYDHTTIYFTSLPELPPKQ